MLVASAALCLNLSAYSQDISLKINNVTVKEAMERVKKDTGYSFVFSSKDVNTSQRVSVSVSDASIEEVIKQILKGQQGLDYEIQGKKIVLRKAQPVSANGNQEKKTVSGKVVDANGDPVIGATIKEKGTTNGTITDFDGVFNLNVVDGAQLEVSYVGFQPQDVKAVYGKNLSITLKEDTEILDEVVVVGYGTQKKVNLTGSVEVVSAKELENRPVTSASALLQGQVAGMTFSTPTGGNAPGSNMTVQIRGQASLSGATPPLVVIDGIPSDMSDFNALNPNDIESISVLKDAAASAVYGARAPYGVLMVTTKMGKRGERISISYSGNLGIVKPVRMPQSADSYTFALAKNQAQLNSRLKPTFTDERLDIILENILHPGTLSDDVLNPTNNGYWERDACYNNDFIDVWLRSSLRQQHNMALKGGGEKSSYYVSAAFVDQPGNLNFVEHIDYYKRFNLNAGVEADITPWMKMSFRSKYSNEISKEPTTEYDEGRSRLYYFAYGAWPTNPIYNPDGSLTERSRINVGVNGGHITNNFHRLSNTLGFDFSFLKGWTAHVDGTWRIAFNDYEKLRRPVYQNQPSGDKVQLGGTESYLAKNTALNRYWTVQAYTNYELKINNHLFNFQFGGQIEENLYRKIAGDAKSLFVDDLPSISISNGIRSFSDAINDWATVGFFGRINYNYKDRYLVELNGRYDGSGRYSSGNRWGFFPSASLGWTISNENFWKNIEDVVNFSKIRVSYGTLGNQGNSAGYLHIPTMGIGEKSDWIFNDKRLPYVKTPGIINMLRTWEKITTFDIGLETKFLNNRLSAEIEYFRRLSWDIIGPPSPKPAVLGTNPPSINNAEFVTKGFEMQLLWRDMINSKWDYSVGFSLADAMSEVTKYNTSVNSIDGWRVGKKFGEIWGYEVNRFLTEDDFKEDGKLKISQDKIHTIWYPGDVKYEDLDGDGAITPGTKTVEDPGDQKILGNSTPRFRYGINLASGYDFGDAGRLDLSVFFEGVAKRDVFLGDSYFFFGAPPKTWESGAARNVYKGEHLDFYRDETTDPRVLEHLGLNKDSYFPRPYDSTEGNKNFNTNSKYLLSGAYMRLKNLTLSYTLSKKVTDRLGINNCKIYFSGENLFVISGLPSYIDPEMVNGGRMYPQQAVYSFGINLGF